MSNCLWCPAPIEPIDDRPLCKACREAVDSRRGRSPRPSRHSDHASRAHDSVWGGPQEHRSIST